MPSLSQSKRWNPLPCDYEAAELLEQECGLDRLVARIMSARGIRTPQEARLFLNPSLDRDWVDPYRIPGLGDVVDRLEDAISNQEEIVVFGDFDVDGISATCLMTCALGELGAHVSPFIPRRFGEGYGLSASALERLLESGKPSLIVTVDTGIAAAEEAKIIVSQGIDVAITDHHEPADLVPQGVAVADPKLDPSCPSHELAGVGVALKIIQALGARLGRADLWRSYTDIATLGTVSDMMPLVGENRSLVKDGITRMHTSPRPGLSALAELARRSLETISADDLAFSLIPRMNAAGRMDDPALALELLMEQDLARARELASELEDINRQRRSIERQLMDEALAMVEATYAGERAIVVGAEGWHEGVKGIVASRLVNKFHVPVLLFTISDGVARGSGRSVGRVNLFEAVEACADLLIRFGGHASAVGVTLEAGNIDAFRDRIQDILSTLDPEKFIDTDEVACLVDLSEITLESIGALECLEPFGQANEVPLLGVCGVTMKDRRRRGDDGKHLSFVAVDARSSVQAIMFNAADAASLCECDEAVDLVCEARVETWQGRKSCKLHVKDVLRRDVEEPGCVSAQTRLLVDGLFVRAEEFVNGSELDGLAKAPRFHTKVVGLSVNEMRDVARALKVGDLLHIDRDPSNVADKNAVRVLTPDGIGIGYLKRLHAGAIAPRLDHGARYCATIEGIDRDSDLNIAGINILVSLENSICVHDEPSFVRMRNCVRQRLADMPREDLLRELTTYCIGDHDLLPAQRRALENLDHGINTLCVMATGRGKSLIFHLNAARCALLERKVSVFVYPLRALVNDQAYHLGLVFEKLGLSLRVLSGQTSPEERGEIFAALAAHEIDIVLTTPEFLAIHSQKFAHACDVAFIVFDEVHHASAAASNLRDSYSEMPRVLAELDNPCVLALSATIPTNALSDICRLFNIESSGFVFDSYVRSNLHLIDERGLSQREDRLVSLLAGAQKSLVYVNSREQTLNLARALRRRVRDRAGRVAFYNAGLSQADRSAVEDAFRTGELCLVVATSAFGEGVNVADVRHVVLYHMPFGSVDFNQMSGRAGRDGADAYIHLAYNVRDARTNERILKADAPGREDLVKLYRVLLQLDRAARLRGEADFFSTNSDIALECVQAGVSSAFTDSSVSCGLSIFKELGFIRISGYGISRKITVVPTPEHMDLSSSIRYLEGLKSLEAFDSFHQWALEASSDDILARINRPILPDPSAFKG